MSVLELSPSRRAGAAFALYKTICRRREATRARLLQQMQRVNSDGQSAASVVAAMASQRRGEQERRTVERATGRWRGSTLGGYTRGDNQTHVSNFRCSKVRLDDLADKLKGSSLDRAENRTTYVSKRGTRVTRKARDATDPPSFGLDGGGCHDLSGAPGAWPGAKAFGAKAAAAAILA